jgi:hypothetical protein
MFKVLLSLLSVVLVFTISEAQDKGNMLVTLSNGTIEISVLPDVGGLLVRASLCGRPNIIQSDSTLWNESPEKRPSLYPRPPFKAYNGHVIWISPQSEWWVHQDSIPSLKASRASWPPDPSTSLAPYSIVTKKTHELCMVSPESPYTKVQITKTFHISKNKVIISATAKNISHDTIAWGLWQNTRMSGWDAVFVRADSSEFRKTNYMSRAKVNKPALNYLDGFYSYESVQPESGQYQSKSFFDVKEPLIAGTHQKQWLIIRSKSIAAKLIHPEQSRVELYIENSTRPAKDLQELEMQFDYHQIVPGASISAEETWEILPASGSTDKNELLKELKKILK